MNKLIYTITLFLILLISFSHANSNGIWTYPQDIRAGVFGADEGLNESDRYVFNNQVHFNRNVTFENASGYNRGIFIGNEGHMISQAFNRLVLYPNRLGDGSFQIRSHESGANFRTELLIRSSGDIEVFENLTIRGNLDLRGEMVNGTVPWARLTDYPSINVGTGLVGGGELDESRNIELDVDFTDGRYVLEGQTNSISTDMIQNNAITSAKIIENSVGLDELNTNQVDERYVNIGGDIMQGDLDLGGNNINNADEIHTRKICDQNGNNCFSVGSSSGGGSTSIGVIQQFRHSGTSTVQEARDYWNNEMVEPTYQQSTSSLGNWRATCLWENSETHPTQANTGGGETQRERFDWCARIICDRHPDSAASGTSFRGLTLRENHCGQGGSNCGRGIFTIVCLIY